MCPRIVRYCLKFQTDEEDKYRCVAFLVSPDGQFSAYDKFMNLRDSQKNKLSSNFSHWRDGFKANTRHHGYNRSQHGGRYVDCYTFKGKDGNRMLRLHGFLCNPITTNGRFQLCAIVHHEHKEGHEIDPRELDKVLKIKSMPGVLESIAWYFRSN